MSGASRRRILSGVVVLASAGLSPTPAAAGCNMNVYVENTGNERAFVHTNDIDTAVKMKGGTWRKLRAGGWLSRDPTNLEPGEKKGDQYEADFGCNKKRRFRIEYHCEGGGTYTDYYPGPTSWSTSQTVTVKLTRCRS